jgi:hypothetical protein
MKKLTRENWLNEAKNLLQKGVFKTAKLTIPKDVKISCGFALGTRKTKASRFLTLGVCHPRSHSSANVNEIFMSPQNDDTIKTLGVLAHELIHAIDDCKSGHGKPFRDMAHAIGLEGKMTMTTESPVLIVELKKIAKKLGKYPHAEILLSARKKQTSRNIKIECTDDNGNGCGFSYRTSRKNFELITNFTCPSCQNEAGYMAEA